MEDGGSQVPVCFGPFVIVLVLLLVIDLMSGDFEHEHE